MSNIDKDIEKVRNFLNHIRFEEPAQYSLQEWFSALEHLFENATECDRLRSELEIYKKIAEKSISGEDLGFLIKAIRANIDEDFYDD